MAKADIQYIQFYTAGSAARELVTPLYDQTAPSQRSRRNRKPILYIDPVAILGMVTALVLCVCLMIAFSNYKAARADYEQAYARNCTLRQEHTELVDKYHDSYDLEQVRLEVILMGYVPASQVPHITVQAQEPAAVAQQPGAFEQAWSYLTELFA